MAIIGTIRKNGWILIVMMVLALGGFILMDVVSNSQRYSAGDINTLGKVNGTEIKRDEFEQYEQLVYSNSRGNTYQVRTQMWNYFVEKALVEEEAEMIGLGIGKEELLDLQFGNNLSPIIVERFKDNTGMVNRASLANIKAAIEGGQFTDPTNRAYWAVQETEIIKKRLEDKIVNAVVKGLYTPTWQAETAFRDNNDRRDALYVRIPYDKVADTEVELTDADYKAFIKDNPGVYDQDEETRIVRFISVDVLPTSGDTLNAKESVGRLVEGFRNADNDSLFVLNNGGEYNEAYLTKDKLPVAVADSLLRLPLGTVVGPYLEGDVWAITKVLNRKVIPDSVSARHILIRGDVPGAEQKIDSLKNLLESGRFRFDSLAVQNSQDPGSGAKGGDLGTFAQGMMVPEFNNVCFYQAEYGKFYKVATQFGWHLIEVTKKQFLTNETGVKSLSLVRRIEPSENTQQIAKDKALAMIQESEDIASLATLSEQRGFPSQVSQALKANDYTVGVLGQGDASREIVRWAFGDDVEAGDVSKELFIFRDPAGGYFDARYVVAGLESIAPKGAATIATIKANPRADAEVKNRKKAETILSKMNNADNFNAVTAQWGVNVDTLKNASMLMSFLPNGGAEPKVIGKVFNLQTNQTSKPITGNSGVYLVKAVSDVNQPPLPADLTMFRRQVSSTASSAIKVNLLSNLKKKADLDDRRSRFF